MKQEHFIFKEKGLYWIERMPDKPDFKKLKKDPVYQDYKFFSGYSDRDVLKQYEEALQSAIESAIPVENQEAVLYELYVAFSKVDKNGVSYFDWYQGILKEGNVYTIECSVEKKEVDTVEDGGGCYVAGSKTVALVTFPENKDGLGDSSRNLEEQEGFDGFIVTIDDGFVAYEYRFPDGYNLSINDIAKAIETGCGLKVQSHKLIE
jgi:hypothetical protein